MLFAANVNAQQYILVNDELPILADDVEKITYEEDPLFEGTLLTGSLAADPKTQLFSQALKLTGLADTLRRNYDYVFRDGLRERYYYKSHTWNEVAWTNAERYKTYTVFAETDEVFAAQGIKTIDDLKAYAKQAYDDAFPEDAGISDPTNRRNSLNRFVAYHILNCGIRYWYLTFYDGVLTNNYVDTDLTDIAAWYRTYMPEAALKVSYPMAGDNSGIYLNRRGLKDGPDKYGKQVRGAKIVADGEEQFEHECFNGYYYHIDRVLAYDQTTCNDVLGSELWRVDFKTLSSDIMYNTEELRGIYYKNDSYDSDENDPPLYGRNYWYKWNRLENVESNLPIRYDENGNYVSDGYLVVRRAHCDFFSWQGDEVNVLGKYDFNVELPPLPVGEWEIRMGYAALDSRGSVRIYLNDQVVADSMDLRIPYYDENADFYDQRSAIKTAILNYMANYYIQRGAGCYDDQGKYIGDLFIDLVTGEKMYGYHTFYPDGSRYSGRTITDFIGRDVNTGETVDWSERANNYRAEAMAKLFASLPKIMKGPRECSSFSSSDGKSVSGGYTFQEICEPYYKGSYAGSTIRLVLGRVKSDGKERVRLRFQSLPGINTEMMLDYFEFCPKAVYDNPDIPEE